VDIQTTGFYLHFVILQSEADFFVITHANTNGELLFRSEIESALKRHQISTTQLMCCYPTTVNQRRPTWAINIIGASEWNELSYARAYVEGRQIWWEDVKRFHIGHEITVLFGPKSSSSETQDE